MESSETEQEQKRKVANNDVISHFERRTIAMCHSRFHRKRIFRGVLNLFLVKRNPRALRGVPNSMVMLLHQIFRTKSAAIVQKCPLVFFAFQTHQDLSLLMDTESFWKSECEMCR